MPYLFGGLALDTDFRFDQLSETSRHAPRGRLVLRSAAASVPADDVVHRSSGRYRLSCGRAGDDWVFRSRFPDAFVFSPDDHRVDCHLASDDEGTWQDVLFRRVLPKVATTYGAIAVHAAAIATGDRCLLLLGASGAGKSTLTTFCATAGWDVLSDDTSLLWTDVDAVVVEPVQRGTGVWEATRDALSLPHDDCTPMPGYDGRKHWYRPACAASEARPLAGILMLDRSPTLAEPRLDRLTPQLALPILVAQNIPFLPEAPGAASAAAFGRVAALSRRVPSFRLGFPDDYAALPRVEAFLRSATIGGMNR